MVAVDHHNPVCGSYVERLGIAFDFSFLSISILATEQSQSGANRPLRFRNKYRIYNIGERKIIAGSWKTKINR